MVLGGARICVFDSYEKPINTNHSMPVSYAPNLKVAKGPTKNSCPATRRRVSASQFPEDRTWVETKKRLRLGAEARKLATGGEKWFSKCPKQARLGLLRLDHGG